MFIPRVKSGYSRMIFTQFTENMENRIYMRTLFVRLFFRTEIRKYGNTKIKKSLIRFCDTDKSRTDKVRRILELSDKVVIS